MALPQLRIQIIKYLKSINLAQFHLHLEQLFIMRQIDNLFLDLLESLEPSYLVLYRISFQIYRGSSCMDHQRNRIVEFANNLCYFQMNPSLYLFFFRTVDQSVLVDSKVILAPLREYAIPDLQIALHSLYSLLFEQKDNLYNNCMGWCFSKASEQKPIENKPTQSKIQSVDVVKFKLKKARDTIQTFLNAKTRDLDQIQKQIAQKTPEFKETGNKRKIVPLLQAKVGLQKIIDSGEVRLKVVRDKMDEVQMQQINSQTINVLDDANKYTKQIQEQLQQKDWRNVLQQAQKKYEIQWPDDSQQIQNDPAFQEMWKQLGGDKAIQKAQKKIVEKKAVNVQVDKHKQVENNKKQLAVE